MRSDLARVTAQNESILAPQVNLCDSVLSDLDEGVFLAKVTNSRSLRCVEKAHWGLVWFVQGYLESEDPNSKPLSVVQSIEVGINEIVETSIPTKVCLPYSKSAGKGFLVLTVLAPTDYPAEGWEDRYWRRDGSHRRY